MSTALSASFAEKKRSLGLGSVSKAAAGLAALLPVAASAATQTFTPEEPLSSPTSYGQLYWDPFSSASSTSYDPEMITVSFCGATYMSFSGNCVPGVNWTGTSEEVFYGDNNEYSYFTYSTTPLPPGTVINADSDFAGNSYVTFSTGDWSGPPAIADGDFAYFGYSITTGETTAYGWVRLEHSNEEFSITQWAINTTDNEITVSAIPEPASIGMLTGLLFIGVACFTRWRKRR